VVKKAMGVSSGSSPKYRSTSWNCHTTQSKDTDKTISEALVVGTMEKGQACGCEVIWTGRV
jgi:hypothetical protein